MAQGLDVGEVPGPRRRRRAGQPGRVPLQLRQDVSSCSWPAAARRRSASSPSDDVAVVVTDQRMPKMTGLELLQAVRDAAPGRGRHHPHRLHRRRRADRGDQPRAGSTATSPSRGTPRRCAASCIQAIERFHLRAREPPPGRAARAVHRLPVAARSHGEFDFGAHRRRLAGAARGAGQGRAGGARPPSTVLLRGETGTGKELVARAIHINSPARVAARSCGSTAPRWRPGVLERELFGHEKGAFTGAVARRPGRFELADGGTLFLDEVGDLPDGGAGQAAARAAGARVRAGRRHRDHQGRRPRGLGHQPRPRDADRRGQVPRGPLLPAQRLPDHAAAAARAARATSPLLVEHFVAKFAPVDRQAGARAATPAALAALRAYTWPGNVRELENIIERAHDPGPRARGSSAGRPRLRPPRAGAAAAAAPTAARRRRPAPPAAGERRRPLASRAAVRAGAQRDRRRGRTRRRATSPAPRARSASTARRSTTGCASTASSTCCRPRTTAGWRATPAESDGRRGSE